MMTSEQIQQLRRDEAMMMAEWSASSVQLYCFNADGIVDYERWVALPDGKHIAVANHESNTITTFTVDYEKNVLVQKGRPMKVETPNCILITKKGVH